MQRLCASTGGLREEELNFLAYEAIYYQPDATRKIRFGISSNANPPQFAGAASAVGFGNY
jgi:hypothetical protein